MPVIQNEVSVPANGTVVPLSGSIYEYAQFNAKLEGAFLQQTGNFGDVLMTFNSGPDTLMEEGAFGVGSATAPILYPDHYFIEDDVAQGDRISFKLRNTTGAAIVVSYSIRLTPL